MESSFQLREKSALESQDEGNQHSEADAAHYDIGPQNLFGCRGVYINNEDNCRDKTDKIDDEKGHEIVPLALKIGEEENACNHKTREGNDGNYELAPAYLGGNKVVDQDEHYDRVGNELDELACSVIFDKVYRNRKVPYHIKTEEGDQRPCNAANGEVDNWAGDCRKHEGETENSYELFSGGPSFA